MSTLSNPCTANAAATATKPSRVEICAFPGGERIAVTTSFDDGQTFDRRIVAAFNQWGLKGTFNVNSGKLQRTGKPAVEQAGRGVRTYLDASELAELFRGHEVAVHTVTHPWLERLDPLQIAQEVLEDRRALEELVGYPVRGMAYPFGTYNERVIEVLRGLGMVYSRTTQNSDKCFPPAEPLAWPATAHQYNVDAAGDDVPARFTKWHANPRANGVFYVWGHAYEFDDRDDWAGVERIYKPLSGKPDVWYCTNIELFDYEAARQRLVLSANRNLAHNPSALTVTLNVDGRLVDVPPGQTIRL
ncbi:polysaccharide deacetylase [Opitutaceae bacterium TAV4]|nr:polysaccharide deacetylase [Opitutaceae bacterium TAV3]RRK01536.1 polysaccharide deacetylase [Opitutaceae bacterium TAV4]